MIKSKHKIWTTSDQVALYFKDAILSGELRPGVKLRENEIADLMGTSRSPIREAFRILESEGLVQITPNKGVTVNRLTEKDIDEIYEIRLLLEQYGLRKAWNKASDVTFSELEAIIIRMEKYIQENNFLEFLKTSHEFHECFMKRCENEHFLKIYHIIWNITRTINIFAHSFMESNISTLMEEHKLIFTSLKDNDLEKALEHLKNHIAKGPQRAADYLKMNLNG